MQAIHCGQAASPVSHTAIDGGATTPALHCWPPSIRCAWPDGTELFTRRPPHAAGLWLLQTGPENLVVF